VVTDIDIDRERSLRVTFDDGVVCELGLEELRLGCPCAGCRGRLEQGLAPWTPDERAGPLRIEDAELVGAWGLSIRWSDGHSTGIYAWELLRRWADDQG
jgi:DUF971 family protein